MKKERKEVKGNEVKELKKEVKGVENKMNKEVKGVEKMNNKNKELEEVIKEKGVKEMNKKEVKEMNKGVKELIEEIEAKRLLLVEKVVEWTESLKPVKNVNIKIKGRYYPLIEKETGKLFLIDKVQSKKRNFDTLEQNMKFVVIELLAERKEEIEKEVEEDKRKYLEKKKQEIDKLLLKF